MCLLHKNFAGTVHLIKIKDFRGTLDLRLYGLQYLLVYKSQPDLLLFKLRVERFLQLLVIWALEWDRRVSGVSGRLLSTFIQPSQHFTTYQLNLQYFTHHSPTLIKIEHYILDLEETLHMVLIEDFCCHWSSETMFLLLWLCIFIKVSRQWITFRKFLIN